MAMRLRSESCRASKRFTSIPLVSKLDITRDVLMNTAAYMIHSDIRPNRSG